MKFATTTTLIAAVLASVSTSADAGRHSRRDYRLAIAAANEAGAYSNEEGSPAAASASQEWPASASATNEASASSSSSSSSGTPQNHTIAVGKDGLTFTPWNITANRGDWLNFVFYPKNHTVTQSTFASPCTKFESENITALDSGFIPVSDNTTEYPTWSVRVNSTKPEWFYCAQGNHCQEGMVLAINAPAEGNNTAEAFRAAAMNTTQEAGGAAASADGAYGSGSESAWESSSAWSSSADSAQESASGDAEAEAEAAEQGQGSGAFTLKATGLTTTLATIIVTGFMTLFG